MSRQFHLTIVSASLPAAAAAVCAHHIDNRRAMSAGFVRTETRAEYYRSLTFVNNVGRTTYTQKLMQTH